MRKKNEMRKRNIGRFLCAGVQTSLFEIGKVMVSFEKIPFNINLKQMDQQTNEKSSLSMKKKESE